MPLTAQRTGSCGRISMTGFKRETPEERPALEEGSPQSLALIHIFSIQPYEDCCTVFTPKHPRTRPVLKFVELAESGVEWEEMLREAADQAVLTKIGYAQE